MDSISSVDTHLTISFNAHCLETRVSSILEAAWLTICASLLQASNQKASGCPVPRDQPFFQILQQINQSNLEAKDEEDKEENGTKKEKESKPQEEEKSK